MNNKERCRRICGDTGEHCFIDNEKQIECIADMVINKSFGIEAFLRSSLNESDRERIIGNLEKALKGIHALIDWVGFLRIAHDLRVMSSMDISAVAEEKRDETRFPLPSICQKFVSMKINMAGSVLNVVPTNFSKHGMRFRCPVSIERETVFECTLLAMSASCKEIAFKAVVKYCEKEDDAYVVGVTIEDISDNLIFTFFQEVHSVMTKTFHRDYER